MLRNVEVINLRDALQQGKKNKLAHNSMLLVLLNLSRERPTVSLLFGKRKEKQ